MGSTRGIASGTAIEDLGQEFVLAMPDCGTQSIDTGAAVMTTALDVARYFVEHADVEDDLSNLKLQKLCHYAQGFSLAV